MPQESIGKAFGDLVDKRVGDRRKITLERVDAVLADGRVVIQGKTLQVTGKVPILAGETVPVAWDKGEMIVVLLNQARRGGAAQVFPTLGAPLVEELFIIELDSGLFDVWFRNDSVFAKILENIPPDFTDQTGFGLHWGTGNSDLFCLEGIDGQDGKARVYRLNRPRPNEPFPPGVVPVATLVKEYDFGAVNSGTGPIFGVMNFTLSISGGGTSNVSGNLQWRRTITISGDEGDGEMTSTVQYAGLGETGELLVRINVVGVVQAPFGSNAFLGQMLINVDTATLLANHMALIVQAVNPSGLGARTHTFEISTGVPAAEAGRISLLSVTRDLAGGTAFNNYVLVTPGFITIVADNPAHTIRVIGEFAQDIAVLAVGVEPFMLGTRTRLVYSGLHAVSGIWSPSTVFMVLLRDGETKIVGSDPDLVFGPVGTFWDFEHLRAITIDHADLVYSPADPLPPYNRQFFPTGGKSGNFDIATMTPDSLLRPFAKLKAVEIDSEEENVLFFANASDLQILNSTASLGPLGRFQTGPL